MTVRLYDRDVDMLEFSAVVKTCEQRKNGYIVTLDQTAFFPEGGGQGADHGTLDGVQVLDAHEANGEVEHLVSGPLAVGSEVRGHVDAVRRMDMMQQHSGEHMFSGLVHGLFGYDNVGFHIGTEAVTMDFNGMLTEADVRRVELLANQAVWRDQPVEAFVPSREELANIEYRSKKEIAGDVRIVRIEGVDTCACCGTHVHTTGCVGQIKVIGVQKYKSGVRVSILCGRRALEYENALFDQAKAAGQALSVPTEELSGAVEFTRRASEKCTVSVAHTDASYEEAAAVFDAGATHLTHLYNAMPGIHHRHPGPIGAASERESVTAELICDGHHVHPSAVRMAFRLFPNRVCLISDALRCCGMPDGQYTLGGQDVFLAGGVARLSDGTIAGSAANLYDCMRNAAAFGVPVEQAVLAATAIPAREIGRAGETGSIADGLPADFVVCDDTLARQAVYLGGERL